MSQNIRKIKDAVDTTTNELIFFKGHAKSTYMSDGATVEDAIKNISASFDDIEVNLSSYYTKSEIDSIGFLREKNYQLINRNDNNAVIKPNTYNIWDKNTYPTIITLETPYDNNIINEYVIRFTIPASMVNYSLSFNCEIKWVNNDVPTWESGCTYEISIVDGYAVFLKYFN